MSADIYSTNSGWTPSWTFGEKVRKIRKDLGYDQASFAKLLGVGRAALGHWEAGRNAPAHLPMVARNVSFKTGVSEFWLLEGTGHHPTGPGLVGEEGLEPPTFRVEDAPIRLWAIAS